MTAHEVSVGDRVRLHSGMELTVARIESPFLGRDALICLIEDTPQRWLAQPVPRDADVEVRRPGSPGGA